MTAADYDDDFGGAYPSFSRWIVPALVLSIALHVAFWFWAKGVSIAPNAQEYYEKFVPRAFRVERAEIDPKVLEPEPADASRPALAPQAVALPRDQVAFEKLLADTQAEPAAPRIDHAILSEKPTAATEAFDQALRSAERRGGSVLEDPISLKQAILDETPAAGGRSVSDLVAPDALTGRAIVRSGPLQGGDKPGFSNLDELLAQTGPLTPGTAPILMPTDLLFDYDQAVLQAAAVASLEKLGTLIRRNPQAVFLIEGHTDSFGSDEYNLALSQQRADVVKMWLINVMNIPPDRIEARGLGESRLIAPGSGTIEEQQINRRVEIVIRDRKEP